MNKLPEPTSRAELNSIIVGPGRVGSTALVDLINRRSDVFCIDEDHSLPLLKKYYGQGEHRTEEIARAYLSLWLSGWEGVPSFPASSMSLEKVGGSVDELTKWLRQVSLEKPKTTIKDFYPYLCGYYAQKSQAHHVVEKTPDAAMYLGDLSQIWPDLGVVLMTRDAPRCAVSMKYHPGYRITACYEPYSFGEILAQQPLPGAIPEDTFDQKYPTEADPSGVRHLELFFDIWCTRIETALKTCEDWGADRFMVLRSEDLVSDPAHYSRQLESFLGLEPDEEWRNLFEQEFVFLPRRKRRLEIEHAESVADSFPRVRELRSRLGYC